MIIKCRICGSEFYHPEGTRGKKPDVCKSELCRKAKQKEYNANYKNHKEAIAEPDMTKAGWPPDTKLCQKCGKLFISDSKSRVCPVCLSDEPLPKQLDESLVKVKEAGFDPVDYGKYKAAKTLAGIEPIDVGLAKKMDETKQAIEEFRSEPIIVEEVRPEYIIVPEEPIIEQPQPQHRCDTCQLASNHDFICALEDLMDMADKWHMDPDKVYPLAEDILRKGIMNHNEAGR